MIDPTPTDGTPPRWYCLNNMGMTPTQKPRIKRDYSLTMRSMQWFCRGSGQIGYAGTPQDAYNHWVIRMRQFGKAPYPNFWS